MTKAMVLFWQGLGTGGCYRSSPTLRASSSSGRVRMREGVLETWGGWGLAAGPQSCRTTEESFSIPPLKKKKSISDVKHAEEKKQKTQKS